MAASLASRLAFRQRVPSQWVCDRCCTFSTSALVSSGHSRWSTIRHDKAKNDKAKSKERGLLSQEIITASQLWGPDPKDNPRLQLAIAKAKQAQTPKSVIETAIARGQGVSASGQALETITIEAMLPGTVAAVIECMSENKARVLQDVRSAIKEHGGTVTPTTYLFEKKGRIIFEKKEDINADDYLDQAIEAGATDLDTDTEGRLVVYTEPPETKSVGEVLSKATGLVIEQSQIIWDPNRDTMVKVENEEHLNDLEDAVSALREESSVHDIYINTEL
ncbi:putative transcriptional regulatory protein ASA_2843 [Talaromyces islandicus]|uniref:Putative transcriptional regulatory protein ASA_2843 n=1 Tax=Talaromyces islandicus TaxID=28573 RepID=A0A0U1LS79_TALIS|nr:putative transcriptional regulatory protein ASA_2843 [Talaromyces islandicus]